MKIGVVDDHWVPPEGFAIPEPEEWWLVHIVHETNPGVNRGCLIMRPVSKVEMGSMNRLIPGFFTTEQPNPGTLVITPKHDPHGHWYTPLKLKNELMAKMGLSLIVVNLGGAYWGKDKAFWGNDEQSSTQPQDGVGDGNDDDDEGETPRDIFRKRYMP